MGGAEAGEVGGFGAVGVWAGGWGVGEDVGEGGGGGGGWRWGGGGWSEGHLWFEGVVNLLVVVCPGLDYGVWEDPCLSGRSETWMVSG